MNEPLTESRDWTTSSVAKGTRVAYDGLEGALIERSDSTFPPPPVDCVPVVQGLEPRSLARFFELLEGADALSGDD